VKRRLKVVVLAVLVVIVVVVAILQDLSPAACKMEKLLDYTTGDIAIWCRVAFTLDRLVAVLMPLYMGRACGRPMSARLYVLVASVAAVAKNAHVLATRGAEYRRLAVCRSDGSLYNETTLVDVCGYTNPRYAVSATRHTYCLQRPQITCLVLLLGRT